MKCPCGAGLYDACCGPRHSLAAPAQTAEQLMRSRYSAFALGLGPYLAATQRAPFDPERTSLPLKWVSLTVHRFSEAEVEFTARYLAAGSLCSLHEVSAFEKVDGRWLYTTGEPELSEARVERNSPCPCGSGKKFKGCCA